MEITDLTAFELSRNIASRDISASEAADAYFARIRGTEPVIGAYLRTAEESVRKRAGEIDRTLAKGERWGPLAGIPIAVKDNILTEGVITTAGSRITGDFVPPYDATVVARLKSAGALILGKTNLDEFAMGSSCEYSAFQTTRNPWDTRRVPGGSSGGSAAAVVSGSAAIALGSDTGGSIRQPAAFCGAAGLKPTYGLVSRCGLVAFASSLDQIGPIGRDTRDLAFVMSVIAGRDENDSTSLREPCPDFLAGLEEGVDGMSLGVPAEYVSQITDDEVKSAFERTIETYQHLGASIEEVSLPHAGYSIAAYYIIAPAEASSNLARFTGIHYSARKDACGLARDVIDSTRTQFGPEVKRRIMLGSFVLSAGYYDAYYLRAAKTRTLITRDFADAFKRCDALLSPVTPAPAFPFGEKLTDPLDMYLCDVMTVGVNLAGLPGLSIPCGRSDKSLPFGLQIIGPRLSDAKLLRIGRAYERETGLSNLVAPVNNGGEK